MDHPASRNRRAYGAAVGIIVFLGLYQGVVPLIARSLFGRDQRFAPALWLPSPWWWIACLALVAATGAALAIISNAGRPRLPAKPGPTAAPASTPDRSARDRNGTGAYDAAAALVFLIGIYNGVAPFIARFVFDRGLLLALPARLSAPWWWITSIAVIVVCFALLVVIDRAKQRRH